VGNIWKSVKTVVYLGIIKNKNKDFMINIEMKKRGRPSKAMNTNETKRRGRPSTKLFVSTFNPDEVKLFRGSDLRFSDSLFQPMKTNREIDTILSTDGGLMPGTNMVLVGGPGSGKSTVALDMLADFTNQGYKCLFVSAEMDEIAHYKYCKRMPKFQNVQTLFLKNYADNIKDAIEYVFDQGYDVIAIDSIAEVIEMYKDTYRTTESAAEFWFLNLQDKHKKGGNGPGFYTTFINIQQVTKAGDFAGSNRLKHMTDAMCHVERDKDGLQRSLHFSKNRDCDKDYKVYFSIFQDFVHYSYETTND
jgi:predicted ATP-dependent serine protease